jgi:hypothetical protein
MNNGVTHGINGNENNPQGSCIKISLGNKKVVIFALFNYPVPCLSTEYKNIG